MLLRTANNVFEIFIGLNIVRNYVTLHGLFFCHNHTMVGDCHTLYLFYDDDSHEPNL